VEIAAAELVVGSWQRECLAVADGEPEALHWRRRRRSGGGGTAVLVGCGLWKATANICFCFFRGCVADRWDKNCGVKLEPDGQWVLCTGGG
jgi:hypothetical protein